MARASSVKMRVLFGARSIVAQFTARTLIKSSLLFGLLVGGIVALQGFGYTATYTTPVARAQFAQTLSSNPGLGILYGASINLTEPVGYIAYRCLPILMIAAALWSLAVITKRLRGQEDDGRWELLLTGETTAGRAVVDTLVGCTAGLAIVAVVSMGIIAAVGSSPEINATIADSLFFGLCVLSVAALFMGIGALTSQLGGTRRRAMLFGVGALGVFYVLRAIGNVVGDLSWLRNFTPFGWVEMAHPFNNPEPLWLTPVLGLAVACAAVAVVIASKRDLGESIITEKATVRSRFNFLSSAPAFTLRLTWASTVGWTLGILMVTSIITGISHIAVNAVSESNIGNTLSNFAGGASAGITLSFMSMASFFAAMLVMVMIATNLAAMRNEEAKSFIDNLLARQTSRIAWLGSRIVVMTGASATVMLVANTVGWAIANSTGVNISAHDMIFEGLNLLGPVAIVIGLGVFLYGFRPRLAALGAYFVIGWSFIIDMLRVATDLPKWLTNTSVFNHVALVPAVHPNWVTFAWLIFIGLVLTAAGAYLFTRRDLQVE